MTLPESGHCDSPMSPAWTEPLQRRGDDVKLCFHGDLAPLERPALVSAPPVPTESLTLNNYETSQSKLL